MNQKIPPVYCVRYTSKVAFRGLPDLHAGRPKRPKKLTLSRAIRLISHLDASSRRVGAIRPCSMGVSA